MTRASAHCRVVIFLVGLSVLSVPGAVAADELPRRGMLGVRVAAVSDDVRVREQLARREGVLVEALMPGAPAEREGVAPGDVVVAVDGRPVDGVDAFLTTIGRLPSGQRIELTIVRNGQRLTPSVTLAERPRDRGDTFDVLYHHVVSRGARIRTIVTKPHASGKYPVIFLIKGAGLGSLDEPLSGPQPYSRILREFAVNGYVTVRVDKPGVGDSEGGPAADLDFATELDAYREALRSLPRYEFADQDNVFIVGHSMGGVFASILAAEFPVKGVAVYGTVVKTWTEYFLENWRRQAVLRGADPASIDAMMRDLAAALHYLLIERKMPEEVVRAHPDLRAIVRQLAPEGRISGRAITFWTQLARENLPSYWAKGSAHVLAIWGKNEFIATEADHQLIADVVNRARPGKGLYLALDGIDHGFHATTSTEDSYRRWKARAGVFEPRISVVLKDWTERIRRSP